MATGSTADTIKAEASRALADLNIETGEISVGSDWVRDADRHLHRTRVHRRTAHCKRQRALRCPVVQRQPNRHRNPPGRVVLPGRQGPWGDHVLPGHGQERHHPAGKVHHRNGQLC